MTNPSFTVNVHKHTDAETLVVFLIGMKIHRWWKPWTWLPIGLAMRRMLAELYANPDSGFLGAHGGATVMTQYWRSMDELLAYAADRQGAHYPAWAAFNRALKKSGDVGIWHETYNVDTTQIEAIYTHMPPTGLGTFLPLEPASGKRRTARGRLAHNVSDEPDQVENG